MTMTIEQAMKELYKQEINCQIHSDWDGGWCVQIGDELNGFAAEKWFANEEIEKIPLWLIDTVKELYPEAEISNTITNKTARK